MTSGFTVDTVALAQHTARFPGLADQAGLIHERLCRALDAVGNCWGDDEAGQEFAAGHSAPAQDTVTRLGALRERLADTGRRFDTMATSYRRADEDSARALRAE